MTPATKPTEIEQPGAHLRLVSDRAAGAVPGITLSGVSKTYRSRDGDVPSLKPLDFHINEGEFFVVVGPSGCGKSTLLKMISGLLAPSTGEILVDGEQVTKPHGNVGIVFQNALLLPWRRVIDNILLQAEIRRLPMAAARERAMQLIEMAGLKGFELTIPLYRTPETKGKRPFQVTDQNMTDTVNLLVEYGGLDAKAKDNPKAFYTNDYLPKGGS